MISKAKQLASITAAGVSAIALTGGKAEAGIIYSNVLDVTIGFSSNSNPAAGRHTVASHVFNSLTGGPSFKLEAVSFGAGHGSYNRFIEELGAGFVVSGGGLRRFAVGAQVTGGMGIGNGFDVGQRSWNSNSTSTNGLPGFSDKYLLFRFAGATTEYGWVEASMSVTDSGGSSASYGPNLTIIQYAFDNTGAHIAAGELASTPEPSSIVESCLAALVLGAEGLRRWRKARKAA